MVLLAEEWATPANREKATDAIIRTGEPIPALTLARWQRGDQAAIETLEAIARDHRKKGLSMAMTLYCVLGPKLTVEPRVQAVARSLGFPPTEGARE